MKKRLRLFDNQRGQGMVEYLILVALMGVATIGLVRLLNQTVNAQFANVINALQGDSSRAKKTKVKDSDYNKKDLGDFMNGAAKRRAQKK